MRKTIVTCDKCGEGGSNQNSLTINRHWEPYYADLCSKCLGELVAEYGFMKEREGSSD